MERITTMHRTIRHKFHHLAVFQNGPNIALKGTGVQV